jgi:TRAP-type C4-dicarboxylate transport system substrate-binding protein
MKIASSFSRVPLGVILFALLLVLFSLMVAVGAEAGRKPKAKVEFKIATLAPDGSTWMKIMEELDAEIREETDGEAGLKFYPGGIQGDETVVLRKIRAGQLHGGGFSGVGLGEIAPSLRVLEVPFLFRSLEEVRAVQKAMGPTFEQILRDSGWELLGWADVGFVYLFSKKPLRTKKDLQKIRMWLWEGDPLAETFLKEVGVSPVPLPITDVVTSLQTGLIDAVYASPYACIALQWFTRVSAMTDFPVTHAMGAVVVKRERFEKLSESAQATVKTAAETHFARLAVETTKQSEQSIQVLREKGIEVVTLGDANLVEFAEVGQSVREQLVGSLYERQILEAMLQALAEYRSLRSSTEP